jgi:hypothetical protein
MHNEIDSCVFASNPFRGRPTERFAQQLGGQLKRVSNSRGTTVYLILPSREGS